MTKLFIAMIFISITVGLFYGSKIVYRRFPSPMTLPIFLTSFTLILLLLSFDISYQTYMIGGKWIDQLLGPVVVALALPLYRQIHVIKKDWKPISIGIFIGGTIGILTGCLLTQFAGFSEEIIRSIAAKSVTTPVAISITESSGGNVSLAAVFVMIAGVSGAMFGPTIVRMSRLKHPIAKGLGLGAASHAIGTAKALELGEQEGAVSALSMTISAVIVSFFVPLYIYVFL
ncbi:LrgB family protein [Gracilibacillus halophilus YIM-C55.5]|uniref:LrgB family protein n=1 Tax=Gracilibacillus halophilus YIM-C55.5 TaxID=1308866 RepID=N4WML7_9BACI|nr:LrgB family protein [Gracilibacillus halophilus]ENH95765.1 LrgB family protein [Gracilibacillus halophilus YIM-C55.5]